MSRLKYVCVSDLHLGADYSLMTRMNPDGRVDLLRPAATLAALGRALRETVRSLSGPELPTLILLGDVLDLGQSPFGEVAQGFKRFVEVMFPPDEPPVFSNQLLTLPGNHDHHLWRTAQDRFFLQHLSAYRDAKFIPDLIEHTPLFTPGDLSCDLMTQVMQGYAHLSDARVRIAYPNLGLIDADRARCVALHHGHYIDATYRLMSSINSAFRGGAGRPETVARIEAENGAWVDFLFSDLGSAGMLGKDIDTLYQMLRDAAASHRFSQQLSDALLTKLSSPQNCLCLCHKQAWLLQVGRSAREGGARCVSGLCGQGVSLPAIAELRVCGFGTGAARRGKLGARGLDAQPKKRVDDAVMELQKPGLVGAEA